MSEIEIPKGSFGKKVKKTLGKLPFVPKTISMYYSMKDKSTPRWAKMSIAFALLYFVFPIDMIPDILGPIGYVDDAAVVAAVFKFVHSYLTDEHRGKAKKWLDE
jgi:uncharacterized membrane protein YkvA (DUF1232 family)